MVVHTPERKKIVELIDVSKTFGSNDLKNTVLNNVNLTIYEGDFLMVLGKSGSGKTTLMNIIGFLDRISSGSYSFLGEDVSKLNENKKSEIRNHHFGFIFQQFFLINSLNVMQNVELPLIYASKTNKRERKEAAEKYLDLVGIPEKLTSKTKELSGGQQQRVAIARALVNEPILIMADEPTGALDSETGIGVMELLKELNSHGKTIVMVTHDEDLLKYATRVIRMQDGSFMEEGALV
ncbi:MAG TPA: ABC transporter ATP-binding protein [Candidatus Jeotgalibaca pullicola]|uniref:ABC transporter ATP-binding protein n=1 Tax=Jeotgalibaca ciconiae TaxID=2496265 RepID=A0A3S9H833_9LACT|nr:ABC transporter ATP-binding protein [Jeotgalibaca ciconiae]HJB24018.1 ABC transporter ATP-binding protein [Candidatus Jeotgalibaca pullicola]